MNTVDELRQLQDLHRIGALSDDEFTIAKSAVLAKGAAGSDGANEPVLNERALQEHIKLQNEVARLDREWELERERYMIAGRSGLRYIPNRSMSVIAGIIVAVFGLSWTMSAAFRGGGLVGVFAWLPAFGVLFTLFGIGMCIYSYTKASQYEEAYQAYQQRRSQMLAGHWERTE